MRGRIAALSMRALALAVELPPTSAPGIARWLYRYGTAPRGVLQDQIFGSGDHPMAILGLTDGGGARRVLERRYEATTYPGWLGFARIGAPLGTATTCKLYVSPNPEALAAAFPVIADVFNAMDVRAFKVGRGLDGLLRPDKIVAHFDDGGHLEAVAMKLRKALHGYPAQGVPFSTGFDADGMLSWGIDPPYGSEAASWRSWVTKRLADALVAPFSRGQDRLASVLNHMARIGVDSANWTIDPGTFGAAK